MSLGRRSIHLWVPPRSLAHSVLVPPSSRFSTRLLSETLVFRNQDLGTSSVHRSWSVTASRHLQWTASQMRYDLTSHLERSFHFCTGSNNPKCKDSLHFFLPFRPLCCADQRKGWRGNLKNKYRENKSVYAGAQCFSLWNMGWGDRREVNWNPERQKRSWRSSSQDGWRCFQQGDSCKDLEKFCCFLRDEILILYLFKKLPWKRYCARPSWLCLYSS